MTNPVLANGLAGLATSATAQATVEVESTLVYSAPSMAGAETNAPSVAPCRRLAAFRGTPHPILGLTVRAARAKTEPRQARWTCSGCSQRILLWERRNNTVEPFGETVQQVYARISALRDRLDGPVVKRLATTPRKHLNCSVTSYGRALCSSLSALHAVRCLDKSENASWLRVRP